MIRVRLPSPTCASVVFRVSTLGMMELKAARLFWWYSRCASNKSSSDWLNSVFREGEKIGPGQCLTPTPTLPLTSRFSLMATQR